MKKPWGVAPSYCVGWALDTGDCDPGRIDVFDVFYADVRTILLSGLLRNLLKITSAQHHGLYAAAVTLQQHTTLRHLQGRLGEYMAII